MISFNHIKKANVSPSGRRHPDVCRGLNKAGRGAADMPFSDGLSFPTFGNMAGNPATGRGIVADTDIRATSEDVWAEAGIKHGDAVFRGQPELFEQGQDPDGQEIGLQDVEHGKERPASERDFFRCGRGGRLRCASVSMCWTNTP